MHTFYEYVYQGTGYMFSVCPLYYLLLKLKTLQTKMKKKKYNSRRMFYLLTKNYMIYYSKWLYKLLY